jgi:hypothetical protein
VYSRWAAANCLLYDPGAPAAAPPLTATTDDTVSLASASTTTQQQQQQYGGYFYDGFAQQQHCLSFAPAMITMPAVEEDAELIAAESASVVGTEVESLGGESESLYYAEEYSLCSTSRLSVTSTITGRHSLGGLHGVGVAKPKAKRAPGAPGSYKRQFAAAQREYTSKNTRQLGGKSTGKYKMKKDDASSSSSEEED